MNTSERRLKARVLIMRNEVAYSIVGMRHAAEMLHRKGLDVLSKSQHTKGIDVFVQSLEGNAHTVAPLFAHGFFHSCRYLWEQLCTRCARHAMRWEVPPCRIQCREVREGYVKRAPPSTGSLQKRPTNYLRGQRSNDRADGSRERQ